MNTVKQRKDDLTRWNPAKLLVKPTETVELETAIYADQTMLENMTYRAMTIVNIALIELVTSEE